MSSFLLPPSLLPISWHIRHRQSDRTVFFFFFVHHREKQKRRPSSCNSNSSSSWNRTYKIYLIASATKTTDVVPQRNKRFSFIVFLSFFFVWCRILFSFFFLFSCGLEGEMKREREKSGCCYRSNTWWYFQVLLLLLLLLWTSRKRRKKERKRETSF